MRMRYCRKQVPIYDIATAQSKFNVAMPTAAPGKRKPQEPLNAAGLGVYRGAAGSSATSLAARNSLAKTAAGDLARTIQQGKAKKKPADVGNNVQPRHRRCISQKRRCGCVDRIKALPATVRKSKCVVWVL